MTENVSDKIVERSKFTLLPINKSKFKKVKRVIETVSIV